MGVRGVDGLPFRVRVEREIQKAQRLHYCVSIVCFTAEVPPAEQQGPFEFFLEDIVTRGIRGTDVLAPWAPAALALLLIDAGAAHLPSILRRVTDRLGTVGWSAGGACYPTTATRAEDLWRQAVDSMVRAKQDGGDRLYVAA